MKATDAGLGGDPRPARESATRVVICEDLALLREGLVGLLERDGFEVVAAVGDAESFEREVEAQSPDVCVVDVRLPPAFTDEGLRAAIAVRDRHPGLPVLILSQYVERTYARELLADGSGGVGYLLKDRVADPADFAAAVHRVAEGGTALDPEAVAQLLGEVSGNGRLEQLTPREGEVLSLMAEGRSNSGIAVRLVVTERAIEKLSLIHI